MRERVVTILVLALIIAAGASLIVYRMVQAQIGRNRSLPTTRIVVAAHNLGIGALLHDSDVKLGEWTGPLPKGMISMTQAVVGRGVVAPIYEGEPILESRLALKEAGGGLAATIPPGMRACAVKVNEVVGVSGFAVPGMRVDVLVAGVPPSAAPGAGPRVKTILQNIAVLSAGQDIQKDAEGKPVSTQVVNLLVTPEQAELLSLASNETHIQLVLRNPTDTLVVKVPGSGMTSLFADVNPPPVAAKPVRPSVREKLPVAPQTPPAPQVFVIEVLNGPKKAQAAFSASREESQ